MSEIIIQSSGPIVLPEARVRITVRVATLDDLPFIDALQKKHSKQLGFFPRAQMEGYLKNQWVLVAEEVGGGLEVGGREDSIRPTTHNPRPTLIGYVASRDRYLKRDELGVIYRLCVSPGVQRKLVGAALVKAVFERSAYGCRLYCCWCAKDLEANYFWESLGFVPVAFRAGGKARGGRRSEVVGGHEQPTHNPRPTTHSRQRVHIFWQKRIVEGDAETKWWYPCQTNQGAIREDRLVFPIPPGTHWKEVEAVVVPGDEQPKLEDGSSTQRAARVKAPVINRSSRNAAARGGFRMGPIIEPRAVVEKPVREKRTKAKADPKLVAAARELRDRWLEKVNTGQYLPGVEGKYDVSRQLEVAATEAKQTPLLTAA